MLRILLVVLLFVSLPLAAAEPRPLLVLGDSLSAAYGLAPQEGWVALLAERVQSSKAPIRKIVNASISGETSAGGLARLPALLAEHKPALVVIELGANDGLRGLPLAQLRDNLAKILAATRAAGARAVLVGIELPINYGPQYRDGLRELYRGLAHEFNVPLVPFLLEGVALDPALMQDDGLHPKAAAEPRVLENVWKVLEPALKALPKG
ncbi:arylesterase [Dokdonella sp.]|uniref:arylesterase n=1 Tax=Dokdonella sp. TaxID=2291710 RepID=UPI0037842C14